MSEIKHVAFLIEIPAIYTDDLDSLREYHDEFQSESDWLLNCIGEPSITRVRMEISGEKDSDVVEVWGSIREARLVEPSRGYDVGSHLTDEQLEEYGSHQLMRDKNGCEWCDCA